LRHGRRYRRPTDLIVRAEIRGGIARYNHAIHQYERSLQLLLRGIRTRPGSSRLHRECGVDAHGRTLLAPAIRVRRPQEFLLGPSPPLTSFHPAANKGFVNFNHALQSVAIGAHHRSPELMKHRPRCLLALETHDALQPQRADAELLLGDVPCGCKPRRQRRPRLIKDRPGSYRRPSAACLTHPHIARRTPRLPIAACGASKPVGQRKPSRYFLHVESSGNQV